MGSLRAGSTCRTERALFNRRKARLVKDSRSAAGLYDTGDEYVPIEFKVGERYLGRIGFTGLGYAVAHYLHSII